MSKLKSAFYHIYSEKDPSEYAPIPTTNVAVLVDMDTELDFPCVIKTGTVETLKFSADIFIAFAVAPVKFMVVELIPDKGLLDAIYSHTMLFGYFMANLDVDNLPFFIKGVSVYS